MLLGAWSLFIALKTMQTIFASRWFASDGKPILSSNSQYDICFSLKTKRRARSLTFSSFAVMFLLQKCQVSEQYLKWGMMNSRYRHFLVSNGRMFFIRLSTAICWETFLHTFAMCLSNFISHVQIKTVTDKIDREDDSQGVPVFSVFYNGTRIVHFYTEFSVSDIHTWFSVQLWDECCNIVFACHIL